MARKTLLTESEIRQFMKLANLSPIRGEKLQEMGYEMPGARDDEEHVEDELHATEDELGAEDDMAGEEGDELDMADDELADDDADMSGIDDSEREELMADVVAAVADALGISDQVSIEAGAEGGDLDEPAVDDLEMDAAEVEMEPVPGGEEIELGAEEEEEVEEPMMEKHRPGHKAKGDAYIKETSEDDIVAEVARRVATRLQAERQRERVVEKLAERIMKRLTK